MLLKFAEIVGYERLMTTNIQRLVYTPTSPYQLILGSNGSGKSSLMAELSPLPAHKSNYTKDGMKRVIYEHRGSTYEMISTFKNGNKHTFIKDGEVLNNEGTALVQKELVRQHFNYWGELHDLLTGRQRFTRMAPQKRRDWITLLSKADYKYALGKFNEFKSAARDALGALRDTNKRLTSESQSLKALNEVVGLDERADLLRLELTHLLTARVPNLPHYTELQRQIDDALADVDEFAREIAANAPALPKGMKFNTMDDVRAYLHQIDGETNTTHSLLNHYSREYADIESILQALAHDGIDQSQDLEALTLELNESIREIAQQIELFPDLVDAFQLKRDSDQAISQMVEVFNQLPDNSDRRFTRDLAMKAREELQVADRIIDTSNNTLSKIRARLNVIEASKDTSCPSCGYVWREGYSQQEVTQLEQRRETVGLELTAGEERRKAAQSYLDELDEYMGLYNRFRGLINTFPRLQPLWDHILKNNYQIENPRAKVAVFYAWQRDVDRTIRLEEIHTKIRHIEQLKEKQQSGEGVHFNQRLLHLGGEIALTNDKLRELKQQGKVLRTYYEQLQRLEDRALKLQHRMQDLDRLSDRAIDAYRNYQIDQVVVQHQNELGLIQRQLTERTTLQGVVDMLTRTQEEIELDYRALDLMTKALSPTEGLIAEQLSGSIGCQVAQWNAIIASIWASDLQILPCSIEEGELDYYFPVHSGASGGSSDDIAHTSTGQEEIINFAFVLTTMLYLEMQDYPLFLDEFGASFDEQHRLNAMSFVKQLIDSNHHSQLFMISHYIGTHGGLSNPEVLVLDSSNIAVTGQYNTHAVLG